MRQKLTKYVVDKLVPTQTRYTSWDGQLPGFGIRVGRSGRKTFIVRYRPKNSRQKRYVTLGRYGVLTVEEARLRAKQLLGLVANGEDPAHPAAARRQIPTVSAAAVEFLTAHVGAKRKPKTLESYKHALEHHVLPKFGKRQLTDVTRADVANLHSALADTPYMANYVTTVLSSLYGWAERNEIIMAGQNPAGRIEKYREYRRERFLSPEEFARLGAALREAETTGVPYKVDVTRASVKHASKPENRRVIVDPAAIAAIRLLMLTGCRLREILNLRWREVDLERGFLLLEDSKSGRKPVLLGQPAISIITTLPRLGDWVFPGSDGSKPRADLKRPWALVTRRAALSGLRIHDLRHSFASMAAGAGLGLPVIGKLLGHSQPRTTARYVHFADHPLREASSVVVDRIAEAAGLAGPMHGQYVVTNSSIEGNDQCPSETLESA